MLCVRHYVATCRFYPVLMSSVWPVQDQPDVGARPTPPLHSGYNSSDDETAGCDAPVDGGAGMSQSAAPAAATSLFGDRRPRTVLEWFVLVLRVLLGVFVLLPLYYLKKSLRWVRGSQ